ncbi:l-ornithine N5-oxygenase [Mycosarcoma maydis]|uniref:L-ornithine N(5)-monooxygenase n=1 Tax=Mycosarcoma maydis TaxID=5270 RepID=SIDA_MYCMD|nr:l-ornithine N5-oxygenase [Ustilago maydis 521]P56584.2 RecName: Full=L-ornithine N(5)-monooxygenase; Short=OMO; AltName: Full=L-ornithine N(5)-oxygenase [Ustilago maydis 521]KIS70091.1 l-ornithine N5-oxygenase [Ustilago maydis 521]|eukprot:XP_011388351.1 l-ornithine N5-oxygenase [Ustilago maydis 521]
MSAPTLDVESPLAASTSSLRAMNMVSSHTTVAKDEIYDLLGIGFGPAHLALSISLRESSEANETNFKAHFLEKRGHFAWHPALLLPGSQLQVSPLKDLVTLRDPASTYSFYNYLHSHGRLARYINKEQGVPSRREWTSYLAWAARRMNQAVSYGQDVISIEPLALASASPDAKQDTVAVRPASAQEADSLCLYQVRIRDESTGHIVNRYARNLSVAVGGVPKLPPAFQAAWDEQQRAPHSIPRLVHSGFYIPSMLKLEPELHKAASLRHPDAAAQLDDSSRLRLAVIGAGQSSTEMFMNLHSRFPSAIVTMIFRASALVPSDDTGFVNSAAFDPERTDEFWQASETQRRKWLQEFKRTNYSVVRTDLLNELHDAMYDKYEVQLPEELQDPTEKQAGRMEMRRCTEVVEVTPLDDGIQLTMRDNLRNAKLETIRFDAVFLGTGFIRSPSKMRFLEQLKPFYPALDAEWMSRDTIAEEDEVSKSIDVEDEEVIERRREMLRGITRDYRLVPASAMQSDAVRSGKSSPGSGSDASSTSSQQTLASENSTENLPEASLYVLGGNEATHGLSDSLLSIVAHRAGELTTSLLQRLPRTRRGTASSAATQPAASTVASAAKTSPTVSVTQTKARQAAQVVNDKLAALSGLHLDATS